MIICVCEGISDRVLQQEAIHAKGNATAVMHATGAGQDCGCCRQEVERLCSRVTCEGCPRSNAGSSLNDLASDL